MRLVKTFLPSIPPYMIYRPCAYPKERARRHRVLHLETDMDELVCDTEDKDALSSEDALYDNTDSRGIAAESSRVCALLRTPKFAEATYITGFNHSANLYALHRARIYAQSKGYRILWLQAEDRPPFSHFGHLSHRELAKKKKAWLHPRFHAKKTEGIMSLLPFANDMPLRITDNNGRDYKQYNICKGTLCRAKALHLHDVDVERLETSDDAEIVLTYLPTVLFVEIEGDNMPPYPGLPNQWFPLRLSIQNWYLDTAKNIEIPRRGFAVVPNFSSTIHAATGRTLPSVIADLGRFEDIPNTESQMKGYIGLSRVTNAEGLLIAQPFSPKLFSQGPHPYPSLLLRLLRGEVQQEDVAEACHSIEDDLIARRAAASPLKLKNMKWTCGRCCEQQSCNAYIKRDDNLSRWLRQYHTTIVRKGPYRCCQHNCSTYIVCNLCGPRPQEEFSQWIRNYSLNYNNRTSHTKFRCMNCANPPCQNPNCQRCLVCRDKDCKRRKGCTKEPVQLNSRQQPRTLEELSTFECDLCRFPRCAGCDKEMKKGPREKLKQSPRWKNEVMQKRSWLCRSCVR